MTHQLQEHSEWLVLFGAGCVCYGDVLDDGFFDAVLYDDGFFDAVSYRNSSAVVSGFSCRFECVRADAQLFLQHTLLPFPTQLRLGKEPRLRCRNDKPLSRKQRCHFSIVPRPMGHFCACGWGQ